jgi:hypothetical protein
LLGIIEQYQEVNFSLHTKSERILSSMEFTNICDKRGLTVSKIDIRQGGVSRVNVALRTLRCLASSFRSTGPSCHEEAQRRADHQMMEDDGLPFDEGMGLVCQSSPR